MIPLLLSMIGCTSSEAQHTDVLLIMVSGVRADRVGAYGYNPSETPHLDRLASRGTKFLRSYTTSTVAEAGVASLVSGWAPPKHGVRTAGHELKTSTDNESAIGILSALGRAGHAWKWVKPDAFQSGFTGFEQLAPQEQDVDYWLVQMPELGLGQSSFWSDKEYDAALKTYDEMIGAILTDWEQYRPNGLTIVSGFVGSLQGARDDAAVALTDDQLRIPTLAVGGGFSVGWEVSEVVSTLDVAATVAEHFQIDFDAHGTDLRFGGSELAYHESTDAYSQFNARPLVGYTSSEGRYSEGVYGQWYAAKDDSVYPFPVPISGYPLKEATLLNLRKSFGQERGLPSTAWSSASDPSAFVSMDALVRKIERALQRGREQAARRMWNRLHSEVPDAPITAVLERKMSVATPQK